MAWAHLRLGLRMAPGLTFGPKSPQDGPGGPVLARKRAKTALFDPEMGQKGPKRTQKCPFWVLWQYPPTVGTALLAGFASKTG